MTISLSFVTHTLPIWFLVFALLLPRISMALMWFEGALVPYHLAGILPLLFWALLPRVLVLYLIYMDQGVNGWFLAHLVALLVVWSGGGHQMRRRRRRADL